VPANAHTARHLHIVLRRRLIQALHHDARVLDELLNGDALGVQEALQVNDV